MPLHQHHESIVDSQELADGDRFFAKMVSRSRSTPLPEGTVELSQNMRLERNDASVREGLKKLTDNLLFSTPVTIPFVIPSGPLTNGNSFAMYASGVFSDPNDGNKEYIVLASTEKATFWNETDGTTDVPYSGYETVEDEDGASIVQANNKVYIYRGWEGESVAITSITRSGSTATVTSTTRHGLFNGFKVRIRGAAQAEYNGDFTASVSSPTVFTITVSGSPATPATGTLSLNKLKPPLVWDGDFANEFEPVDQSDLEGADSDMPNADYGLWFRNRMVQPYGRDQFILSDLLDPQRFDLLNNQVDVLLGSSDYSVGAHPFQENRVLLFMRKSIHMLSGITGIDLSGSELKEITREVGCCARRTIQTAGNQILWLSDNGVYAFTIGTELNLVGSGFPLSEPISDYFARVNTQAVNAACAIYHDNRYYIACPLDDATRNNYVFVYNLLNQGWESVDVFPAGVYIDDLLVSTYGNRRRVYATNREGAIYLLEEGNVDQTGTVASPTSNAIVGKLWTRAYWLNGANSVKRFNRFVANIETQASGDVIAFKTSTRNPDSVATITTYTSTAADDATIRRMVGKRGNSLSLRIETSNGRPIIRSVSVEGIDYGNATRNT